MAYDNIESNAGKGVIFGNPFGSALAALEDYRDHGLSDRERYNRIHDSFEYIGALAQTGCLQDPGEQEPPEDAIARCRYQEVVVGQRLPEQLDGFAAVAARFFGLTGEARNALGLRAVLACLEVQNCLEPEKNTLGKIVGFLRGIVSKDVFAGDVSVAISAPDSSLENS